MSLQDDIARYGGAWNRVGIDSDLSAAIAASLERDYYLVKLADLPEVTEAADGRTLMVDGVFIPVSLNADVVQAMGTKYIAAAIELKSRESEAAALQARRDELVHQYGYELTYADQPPMVKDLINRLISANADHTRAGERS